MSVLNRLRPKWQNTDPEVRAEAVRHLGKDEVELLTAVAQGDTDRRVRRIAVKKLASPRLLLGIAENDEDESLAAFARRRASGLLIEIACDERDLEESKRALGLLTEVRHVVTVVEKARFEDLRKMAFENLSDDTARAELVCRGKDPRWRSRALERITNPSAFRAIVLNENASEFASTALAKIEDVEILQSIVDHPSVTKPLRRQATSKVEQIAPPDHPVKMKKRHEHFETLVSQAEACVERLPPERPDELEALRREWDELSNEGAAEAELAERFSRSADAMAAARKKPESRDPLPEESEGELSPSETKAGIEVRNLLCGRLEAVEDQSLERELAAARSEWNSLDAESGPATKEVERRFTKAANRIEKRQKEKIKSEAEQSLLTEFVERAELLSESADLDETMREWKELSRSEPARRIPSHKSLGPRFSRASERIEVRANEKSKAQEQEERRSHEQLEKLMTRLRELTGTEQFSIREADRTHREAQQFLQNMGALPKAVSRKKARKDLKEAREALVKRAGEFKELDSWKRWANEDIQAGLIHRIKLLRDSSDLPKVAKEMHRIHEEWKRAGSAPIEKAEELWHRYKVIRDDLKSKCDEFFGKQNEERTENLKKKTALCEKVEAIQDSENWTDTAEVIKKLQEVWKTTGPAPQKHSDAIWKRFRNACGHFFERRKAHFGELKDERDENFKKKREVCEKAESIKKSTDWHETANELKRLQAEWRAIGAVPRKHSDQVWNRFRTACDFFFDRFKRRDEVEHEERLKRREDLVVELEALANADESSAETTAAQAQTVWTDWRELGRLANNDLPLWERFERAMDTVVSSAVEPFAGTVLDPSTSRKQRETLCEQLEAVVKEFHVATQPFEQPLEDLVARLKDALARNTMTGGQRKEKRTAWSTAAREAEKIRASWLRTVPVPGDEGRALADRFESAHRQLVELGPEPSFPPEEPAAQKA
jgi:hypothetical protein